MTFPDTAARCGAPAPTTLVLGSGLALSCAERGDPAGLAVVLLHGYSDSRRSFEPLIDAFDPRLRLVALSLRGHGDSDKPPGRCDAAVMAADVADALDRLGIARAVIVGHSMGSLVAQRFAIDHPRRTACLVLLGAFRTLKGNDDVEAMWRDVVATMTDPADPAFVRDFQHSTLARPVPPAFFEMVVAESLKMPAHAWRSVLRGLLDEDATPELRRIAAPTLVLWGGRDVFTARADQEALAAAIPAARLVVWPDAGHALHWEDPGRAAAEITAFVAAAGLA